WAQRKHIIHDEQPIQTGNIPVIKSSVNLLFIKIKILFSQKCTLANINQICLFNWIYTLIKYINPCILILDQNIPMSLTLFIQKLSIHASTTTPTRLLTTRNIFFKQYWYGE
ncbi:hypothetical protein HZS_7405, partial [Henneguya salminicola]